VLLLLLLLLLKWCSGFRQHAAMHPYAHQAKHRA
jgi:hypothetical protein